MGGLWSQKTAKSYEEPKWMCAKREGRRSYIHHESLMQFHLLFLVRKFSGADVILTLFFFRVQQVGNEAYVLGLSSFYIPSIGAACVCFLEMLGLDSLKLRVDMKVANIILSYKCRNEDAQYSFIRESIGTVPFLSAAWFI